MRRRWSPRSIRSLRGVHPELVAIINEAHQESPWDFKVTEGVRGAVRQRLLVSLGKSWTMNSRHRVQPDGWGHAVDVMAIDPNGDGDAGIWEREYYADIAKTVLDVAARRGARVVWGGSWETKRGRYDGPHFEIHPERG